MMTRHVSVEGQVFQVDYEVQLVEEKAFIPNIASVHLVEHGFPVGPDLTQFLDNMYFHRGPQMVPVLTLIAMDIMQKEMN